ncbi:cytochrome P450 family protein [Longirhabdus pacifica]|uniref:cytochrome P450 family protein n=1 Tax=Longirhabdus pacifica TaxID=2305227 RepID=UPI00100923F4|nr:cytochrome P450 [Longirhabdus pacifica]
MALKAEKLENLDFNSPTFKQQAYSWYEKLREEEPVHLTNIGGSDRTWLVTRYEDVQAILKDNDRFAQTKSALCPFQHEKLPESIEILNTNMLRMEPPEHTRLRRLAAKVFSPRMTQKLEPQVKEITQKLLDKMEQKEEIDLIRDFALPLPIEVISDLLGIPEGERTKFITWSNIVITGILNQEKMIQQIDTLDEFFDYISNLIRTRKEEPGNDLITALIQAHEEEDKLSERELLSMLLLLIVAGHETTVNLINNGVLALLENEEQKKLFMSDPSIVDTAMNEFLRYYSPVEVSTGRWAKQDFVLHGKEIKMGDQVLACIASANRDPNVFEHPNQLDITRAHNPHLAFGYGTHHCLGDSLARLEGRIAISMLFERFPHLQVNISREDLRWNTDMLMRSLVQFPVTLKG